MANMATIRCPFCGYLMQDTYANYYQILVGQVFMCLHCGQIFSPTNPPSTNCIPGPTTFSGWTGYDCCRKETNKPMKLSAIMKRLLDADTQTLVKGGFLDGDLNLTDEGRRALWSILLLANKAEMVKLAQDEIDEQEKKKN